MLVISGCCSNLIEINGFGYTFQMGIYAKDCGLLWGGRYNGACIWGRANYVCMYSVLLGQSVPYSYISTKHIY